jgi:hypothetical protein
LFPQDVESGVHQGLLQRCDGTKTQAANRGDRCANTEFSSHAVEGAVANAKAAELKIVFYQSYPPSNTDFTPIVQAIRYQRRWVHAEDDWRMVRLQSTSIKNQLGSELDGIVDYDL